MQSCRLALCLWRRKSRGYGDSTRRYLLASTRPLQATTLRRSLPSTAGPCRHLPRQIRKRSHPPLHEAKSRTGRSPVRPRRQMGSELIATKFSLVIFTSTPPPPISFSFGFAISSHNAYSIAVEPFSTSLHSRLSVTFPACVLIWRRFGGLPFGEFEASGEPCNSAVRG